MFYNATYGINKWDTALWRLLKASVVINHSRPHGPARLVCERNWIMAGLVNSVQSYFNCLSATTDMPGWLYQTDSSKIIAQNATNTIGQHYIIHIARIFGPNARIFMNHRVTTEKTFKLTFTVEWHCKKKKKTPDKIIFEILSCDSICVRGPLLKYNDAELV